MHADDTMPPSDGTSGGPLGRARWADPEYIADRYAYREGAIWLGRCPHDPERAIGYEDNRHVFLCAETRSGKGRAFLVNNQVLWPGSLIAIDPKGEAVVTAAARRGPGNAHCDGLGQEVYILDPSGIDLPPELDRFRAHFNPLAALRPDDPRLVEKTSRIANAICEINDGDAAIWDKRARRLITAVIRHVITAPREAIEGFGFTRDLLTVRELIMRGHKPLAEKLNAHRIEQAKASGKEPVVAGPFDQLLRQMSDNPACNGEIALAADDLRELRRGHSRGFGSVREAATTQLSFLEGQGIRATVGDGGIAQVTDGEGLRYPSTFRIEDLKDARISVFLCVQERDYEAMRPWLRAMTELLIDAMTERQGLGRSGQRVLFCIDEFANLGEMDSIAKAANAIAGAGVKLMLAVQRLGDLKKLYGEAWEKFIAAAGTQIWFGASADETAKYLESALGQTQVTLYTRGVSTNRGTSSAETLTESYSHTHSLSKTQGSATSKGTTHGQTTGGSKTSSYGSSDGTSAGRNYGPHLFFEPFQRGTTYSRTSSTQRNTADGEQWSSQQGSTETNTENRAETTSDADSTGSGTSRTQQTTEGRSADIREQFHVRPLLLADEARRYLRPMEDHPNDPIAVQEATREHPAYPGLALIRLAGEPDPFFVRKANHDQDPFFVRKFSPNPAFRFVPLEEQPLFGWQITPEFFYTLDPSRAQLPVPDHLEDSPLFEDDLARPEHALAPVMRRVPVNGPDDLVQVDLAQSWSANQRIRESEPLLAVRLDNPQDWLTEPPSLNISAALDFKIMEVHDEATRKAGGRFLGLRAYRALDDVDRDRLDRHFWESLAFGSSRERRARFERERRQRCRDAHQRLDAARLRVEPLLAREHALNRSLNEARREFGKTEEQVTEMRCRFEMAARAFSIKDTLRELIQLLRGVHVRQREARQQYCRSDSWLCFGLFHLLPMFVVLLVFLVLLPAPFWEPMEPALNWAAQSIGTIEFGPSSEELSFHPIDFFTAAGFFVLVPIILSLFPSALDNESDFQSILTGPFLVLISCIAIVLFVIWYPLKFLALALAAPFYPERIWIGSAESERKLTSDALYYSLEPRIRALQSEIARLDDNIRNVQSAAKQEGFAVQDAEAAIARLCDTPR
jgi:type IV secretory pathway TraG/TraD family ATPase VirD4